MELFGCSDSWLESACKWRWTGGSASRKAGCSKWKDCSLCKVNKCSMEVDVLHNWAGSGLVFFFITVVLGDSDSRPSVVDWL